jgi:prevent-host-death family protein
MKTNIQKKNKAPNKIWQLQEAKAMFSEVIKAAALQPQIITVYGKKTAVILSYGEYKKLSCPKLSLFDFFQNSPLRDIELEFPARLPEKTRVVDL